MKKSLLIFTLLFSGMFSSTSHAEWTAVSEGADGDIFFVDFERIKKHSGYVYYWSLVNLVKLSPNRLLSGKFYNQGDCKLFRSKNLGHLFFKEPMGRGTPSEFPQKPDKDWTYPPPDSTHEITLKAVCDYVK